MTSQNTEMYLAAADSVRNWRQASPGVVVVAQVKGVNQKRVRCIGCDVECGWASPGESSASSVVATWSLCLLAPAISVSKMIQLAGLPYGICHTWFACLYGMHSCILSDGLIVY